MFTIPQIISIVIVLAAVSFIWKKTKGLFRHALSIVTILLAFGGYSVYEAVQVPINTAKQVLATLPVDQVQENVKFENMTLKVKYGDQWYSADQISVTENGDGNLSVGFNGESVVLPESDGLGQVLKTLKNSGIIKN